MLSADPLVPRCNQCAVLERVLDLDTVEINARACPKIGSMLPSQAFRAFAASLRVASMSGLIALTIASFH